MPDSLLHVQLYDTIPSQSISSISAENKKKWHDTALISQQISDIPLNTLQTLKNSMHEHAIAFTSIYGK